MAKWTVTTLVDRLGDVLAEELGVEKEEILFNTDDVKALDQPASELIEMLVARATKEAFSRRVT